MLKVESDGYYSIIMDADNFECGENLIAQLVAALTTRQDQKAIDDITDFDAQDVRLDTRCLIGFALRNDEYEFGVGAMSHVIGHKVIVPLEVVRRNLEKLNHEHHEKISKLLNALRAFE